MIIHNKIKYLFQVKIFLFFTLFSFVSFAEEQSLNNESLQISVPYVVHWDIDAERQEFQEKSKEADDRKEKEYTFNDLCVHNFLGMYTELRKAQFANIKKLTIHNFSILYMKSFFLMSYGYKFGFNFLKELTLFCPNRPYNTKCNEVFCEMWAYAFFPCLKKLNLSQLWCTPSEISKFFSSKNKSALDKYSTSRFTVFFSYHSIDYWIQQTEHYRFQSLFKNPVPFILKDLDAKRVAAIQKMLKNFSNTFPSIKVVCSMGTIYQDMYKAGEQTCWASPYVHC